MPADYSIWGIEIRPPIWIILLTMDQAQGQERRLHARYPVRGDLTGHLLSALGPPKESEQPFRGEISDLSGGGLCVFTPRAVSLLSPIRCEVRLADLPVSIPTLVQVRWVERNLSGEGEKVGLQFLI